MFGCGGYVVEIPYTLWVLTSLQIFSPGLQTAFFTLFIRFDKSHWSPAFVARLLKTVLTEPPSLFREGSAVSAVVQALRQLPAASTAGQSTSLKVPLAAPDAPSRPGWANPRHSLFE